MLGGLQSVMVVITIFGRVELGRGRGGEAAGSRREGRRTAARAPGLFCVGTVEKPARAAAPRSDVDVVKDPCGAAPRHPPNRPLYPPTRCSSTPSGLDLRTGRSCRAARRAHSGLSVRATRATRAGPRGRPSEKPRRRSIPSPPPPPDARGSLSPPARASELEMHQRTVSMAEKPLANGRAAFGDPRLASNFSTRGGGNGPGRGGKGGGGGERGGGGAPTATRRGAGTTVERTTIGVSSPPTAGGRSREPNDGEPRRDPARSTRTQRRGGSQSEIRRRRTTRGGRRRLRCAARRPLRAACLLASSRRTGLPAPSEATRRGPAGGRGVRHGSDGRRREAREGSQCAFRAVGRQRSGSRGGERAGPRGREGGGEAQTPWVAEGVAGDARPGGRAGGGESRRVSARTRARTCRKRPHERGTAGALRQRGGRKAHGKSTGKRVSSRDGRGPAARGCDRRGVRRFRRRVRPRSAALSESGALPRLHR